MLNLKPLGENVEIIRKFLEISPISFCDLSIGVKYMWRDEFVVSFDIIDDTLVMAESCRDYDFAFYYPIGSNVKNALVEIENYCKNKNIPLKFCCIDDLHLQILKERYPLINSYFLREWSDYIYDSESFRLFKGKKYSGQRNHINKFNKLYPNFIFRKMASGDIPKLKEFFLEYERVNNISLWTAQEEEKKVFEFTKNAFELKQDAALITVNDKVIAFSVGEKVKDTYIIHVEKALTEYEGVYPTMANLFANAYAKDSKYINREEDCGDEGLRTSKLQYKPIEIKNKNIIEVKTLFELLPSSVNIKTERLTITEINKEDKEDYQRLYLDDELNRYWGYDYREDLTGDPTAEWFFNFQNKLKENKEEFSFAVKLNDKMIGELVLHNFGFDKSLEMGFRFFRESQGKGYAFESAKALTEFIINKLNPSEIKSRCFKQNLPSKNLITKLGLKTVCESETHYFFSKKLDATCEK